MRSTQLNLIGIGHTWKAV